MGRLDTRLLRTRVRMSIAIDLPRPTEDRERVTKAEARRRVIEYLKENPEVVHENVNVTLRLPELQEEK